MDSNFEDADADSSTEDLLVVTRNAAPSLHKDTIDLFSESVPDDSNPDHSDGESEYFSSEETELHAQATGEQATEVIKDRTSQPLHASKQDALDRKNNISLRDTSSQSKSNKELSCQAAANASVATTNNSTNPVNPSGAVLDWNYILTSGIPCNTFETSDAGSLFCLPCSTSYVDFASFESHFHARHAHLLQVHTPASADPAARRRTEPPPLVRTEDEAVDSPANTQASTSRRPVQVYFPRRHHPKPSFLCKQCNLDYTNLPALQRHKASLPDRHPHYCSTCTTEYRDTEDFQSHCQKFPLCHDSKSPESAGLLSISHAIDKAEDAFNIDSIGTQDIPPDEHLPHREDDKEETVSLEDIPICAICISPLTEVADVIATFCGHVFCASCILEHLRTRNNCPRCRKLISSMMLIPLFF